MVSSPWPERIEITSITKTKSDEYAVTGNVVELTSAEVNTGGYADKIPIRVRVQKINGDWLIVDYTHGTPLP
jgi:hypothetical protein